jgi:hypothetical protein
MASTLQNKKSEIRRTVDIYDDKDEPTIFINPPHASRCYRHHTNSYLGKVIIWDEQTW